MGTSCSSMPAPRDNEDKNNNNNRRGTRTDQAHSLPLVVSFTTTWTKNAYAGGSVPRDANSAEQLLNDDGSFDAATLFSDDVDSSSGTFNDGIHIGGGSSGRLRRRQSESDTENGGGGVATQSSSASSPSRDLRSSHRTRSGGDGIFDTIVMSSSDMRRTEEATITGRSRLGDDVPLFTSPRLIPDLSLARPSQQQQQQQQEEEESLSPVSPPLFAAAGVADLSSPCLTHREETASSNRTTVSFHPEVEILGSFSSSCSDDDDDREDFFVMGRGTDNPSTAGSGNVLQQYRQSPVAEQPPSNALRILPLCPAFGVDGSKFNTTATTNNTAPTTTTTTAAPNPFELPPSMLPLPPLSTNTAALLLLQPHYASSSSSFGGGGGGTQVVPSSAPYHAHLHSLQLETLHHHRGSASINQSQTQQQQQLPSVANFLRSMHVNSASGTSVVSSSSRRSGASQTTAPLSTASSHRSQLGRPKNRLV